MNENLAGLLRWTNGNCLTVNASKTKFVLFGNQGGTLELRIGDTNLSRCNQYDYLGIRLDDGLTFKPLIESLLSNCNARLFTLSHFRKYLDQSIAAQIYRSIIMAKLQYGLLFTMCALKGEHAKIQRVQNHALRICGLAGRYVSNLTVHKHFKVLPIMLQCKLDIMISMYKRTLRETTRATSEGVLTHSQCVASIPVPHRNSTKFLNSIAYRGPLIWETIPHHMKGIQDLDSFKKCARLLVMQEFDVLTFI